MSVQARMDAESVRALAARGLETGRKPWGLVEPDAGRLETADLARLMETGPRDSRYGAGLPRSDAATRSSPSVGEAEALLLDRRSAALEASPVAKHEWPAVSRVLDPDLLAPLLGISVLQPADGTCRVSERRPTMRRRACIMWR